MKPAPPQGSISKVRFWTCSTAAVAPALDRRPQHHLEEVLRLGHECARLHRRALQSCHADRKLNLNWAFGDLSDVQRHSNCVGHGHGECISRLHRAVIPDPGPAKPLRRPAAALHRRTSHRSEFPERERGPPLGHRHLGILVWRTRTQDNPSPWSVRRSATPIGTSRAALSVPYSESRTLTDLDDKSC